LLISSSATAQDSNLADLHSLEYISVVDLVLSGEELIQLVHLHLLLCAHVLGVLGLSNLSEGLGQFE